MMSCKRCAFYYSYSFAQVRPLHAVLMKMKSTPLYPCLHPHHPNTSRHSSAQGRAEADGEESIDLVLDNAAAGIIPVVKAARNGSSEVQ